MVRETRKSERIRQRGMEARQDVNERKERGQRESNALNSGRTYSLPLLSALNHDRVQIRTDSTNVIQPRVPLWWYLRGIEVGLDQHQGRSKRVSDSD